MAYSQGSMVGDTAGHFLQKPYNFTTVDDSGTTSPIVVTATSNKVVAPSKAVYLNLQTMGEAIWYKDASTVTASGDYLATASTVRLPVYPGMSVWMVQASGNATTTTRWELMA